MAPAPSGSVPSAVVPVRYALNAHSGIGRLFIDMAERFAVPQTGRCTLWQVPQSSEVRIALPFSGCMPSALQHRLPASDGRRGQTSFPAGRAGSCRSTCGQSRSDPD